MIEFKNHYRYLNSAATVLLITMSIVVAGGCNATNLENDGVTPETHAPSVAATNAALASMTQSIVGDIVEVTCPNFPSSVKREGPAAMPPMAEILRLQRSDIVFTNGPGADDAPWLNLVSIRSDRIHATTSDEFELSDFIQVHDFAMVHSHGDEGEHSHPWLVPHCWLNPRLAAAQSVSILNRLIREYPQHEKAFRSNQAAMSAELDELDTLAKGIGQLLRSRNCVTIASDPRLLFFTRSLNQKDNYLLWFDLPTAARATEDVKTKILQTKLPAENVMILWAQPPGELASSIGEANGIINVVIDRIEVDRDEVDRIEVDRDPADRDKAHRSKADRNTTALRGGYLSALRKNFQAVENAVENVLENAVKGTPH